MYWDKGSGQYQGMMLISGQRSVLRSEVNIKVRGQCSGQRSPKRSEVTINVR